MLTKEKYLELHAKFYDLYTTMPSSKKYVPYENFKIPADYANGLRWSIFHSMASDVDRELLNEINPFFTYLRQFDAWEKILHETPKEDKLNLLFECINPLGILVLNSVYVIQQRFIYACVLLLHQAYIMLDPNRKDAHLVERNINLNMLKNIGEVFKRNGWMNLSKLISSIQRISDKNFVEKTREFRKLYHHRFPLNIEIGYGPFFTRIESLKEANEIWYGLGGKAPLVLSDILPLLYDQYDAAVEAHQTFVEFLHELASIWKSKMPSNNGPTA